MNRPTRNAVLAVGYLAIVVAIVAARSAPAEGYEVSIYAATPTPTWIGLGTALAIALWLALRARGIDQAVAVGLGSLAVTTIVGLPLVRGYRFLGKGDGLTHLGWTRDIVDGALLPIELFYPGVHGLATVIHAIGGFEIEQATQLAALLVFVPFVVFVPLVVRAIAGDPLVTGCAAVLAWCVLPINNVATHMGVHTNSNALFFVPVVLFALVAYLSRRSTLDRLPFGLSAYGVVLVVTGLGLLVIHPQQMVNVVAILAVVGTLQWLVRSRRPEHPIATQPTIYAYTVVLGTAFLVWSTTNERFRDALGGLATGLATAEIGGDETVDQHETSLEAIGGSVTELFVLLFLVSTVVAAVGGLYVLWTWLGRSDLSPDGRSHVTYLGVSLVPLAGIFAVYFFGTGTMAFRQVGFLFVVLTILGAVGLGSAAGWLGTRTSAVGVRSLLSLALAACLVLSLATVFASPLIYDPTQHVSEAHYSGYETAFETGQDDHAYAGLGYAVHRYHDGIHGVESVEGHSVQLTGWGDGTVDPDAFNDGAVEELYDEEEDEYYVVVTAYDTSREFDVYRELHYEPGGLEDLESNPRVNKYVENDEFVLYEVRLDE